MSRQKHLLSNRLTFFFSDANLRHDTYARMALVQYRYLPLEMIMRFRSIKRISADWRIVVEAAKLCGLKVIGMDKNGDVIYDIPQDKEKTDMSKIMIGRTTPYNHEMSVQQSLDNIMIIKGWPVEINTRWIEERLRKLLEADTFNDESLNGESHSNSKASTVVDKAARAKHLIINNPNPIIYWGKNVPEGIITVEFESKETASRAWNTFRSMTQRSELLEGEIPHPAELICHFDDEEGRRCNLMVGGVNLTVHGMMPMNTTDYEKEEKLSIKKDFDATTKILEEMKLITDNKRLLEQAEEETLKTKSIDVAPTPTSTSEQKKWWCDQKKTPSLSQCIKSTNEIYSLHKSLSPPPREWMHESFFNRRLSTNNNHDQYIVHEDARRELCRDVTQIVKCVRNSISTGVIQALGPKDAYAMADFLNETMEILSESPPPRRRKSDSVDAIDQRSVDSNVEASPFEACMEALDILYSLNLDIHPRHYSYAVRSACHEFRWEEAATLFLNQIEGGDDSFGDGIDTSTGGFVPLDSTLGWDQPLEVGLYAVAIDARRKLEMTLREEDGTTKSSPSAKVFDTALKLSMIAPSRQENYVLAAGCALGRAGLFSDCLDFSTDPDNISKYGPSIAAAAMLACIESHRSAEAIELYDFFFNSESQSTASEWQWSGGNLSAAKPLFDDLLLRAYGGPSSGGHSSNAIRKFCEIVDNDTPFSINALLGLMRSIEHDGDWQMAIKLIEAFFEMGNKENQFILVNAMLSLSGIDEMDDAHAPTAVELDELTAELLASAIRTCNKEGFFSLALLLSFITHSMIDKRFGCDVLVPDDQSVMRLIAPQKLLDNKSFRIAYIHSLSKVGLNRLVNAMSQDANCIDLSVKTKFFPPNGESIINAFVASNKVLIALNQVRQTKGPISRDDAVLIARGLANAINFYLDANHPASAMYLFNYANKILTKRTNESEVSKTVSFTKSLSSFFDDDRSEPTARSIFVMNESLDLGILSLSDSLLAAVMKAYTMAGQPEKALDVLKNVKQDEKAASWDTIQSFNCAMEVLLENDVAKFMTFFEDSNSGLVMPSTFLALGRKYARECAWPELGELYNETRRRGCVSEELGLIAMQAVCEAQLDKRKILVLRKIADDISNTVGMKTKDWLTSQYWHIKRYAGFHYARVSTNRRRIVHCVSMHVSYFLLLLFRCL